MQTEKELNNSIVDITMLIREHYPGLYQYLDEMHATLPLPGTPVISTLTLKNWYEALSQLIRPHDRNIF